MSQQFLVSQEHLVPYQPPAPAEPQQVRQMGVNLGRWVDSEPAFPWIDRHQIAREPDDQRRTWLFTMQIPDGYEHDFPTVWRASVVGGKPEWLNLDSEQIAETVWRLRLDPSKNAGVRLPEGAQLMTLVQDRVVFPSSYDRSYLADIRPFAWLRFLNPMKAGWESGEPFDRVLMQHIATLCRETGKRPWLTIPHNWTWDDHEELIDMFRDLDPMVEPSNEHWNNVNPPGKHFRALGEQQFPNALTSNHGLHLAYAQYASDVFSLWRGELGNSVTCVAGSQWTNPWVTDRVRRYCVPDAIAVAPYFGHKLGWSTRCIDITDAERLEICRQDIGRTASLLSDHRALAGDLPIIAYEGGSHAAPTGGTKRIPDVVKCLSDFNRSEAMQVAMREHLAEWFENGGGDYTAFCLHSRPWSIAGDWQIAGNPAKWEPLMDQLRGGVA